MCCHPALPPHGHRLFRVQGAPYAYTPFCDNNKDMDEYRFWKGGFWRDHLQGKPYHISALYLVDLKRFRQLAAGGSQRAHVHMDQHLRAGPFVKHVLPCVYFEAAPILLMVCFI